MIFDGLSVKPITVLDDGFNPLRHAAVTPDFSTYHSGCLRYVSERYKTPAVNKSPTIQK